MSEKVQATTPLQSSHNLAINILLARLQPYVNLELPDMQAGFRKGRWSQVKRLESLLNCKDIKPVSPKGN